MGAASGGAMLHDKWMSYRSNVAHGGGDVYKE